MFVALLISIWHVSLIGIFIEHSKSNGIALSLANHTFLWFRLIRCNGMGLGINIIAFVVRRAPFLNGLPIEEARLSP